MATALHFIAKTFMKKKNYFNINSVFFSVPGNQNFLFKHLSVNENNYKSNIKYEISSNSNEWDYVEQLLPFKTVPEPQPKVNYPSGWKPVKDCSLSYPYFVERSKNHMLSVYLDIRNKDQYKVTTIKRIHGNIWQLHDELKAHITEKTGKRVSSYVHEGNNVIYFKGDLVYYIEQWLLCKGF